MPRGSARVSPPAVCPPRARVGHRVGCAVLPPGRVLRDTGPATGDGVSAAEMNVEVIRLRVEAPQLHYALHRDALWLLAEVDRLREGLRQVVEGDYPADAGDEETWAREVLDNPAAVDWEDVPT